MHSAGWDALKEEVRTRLEIGVSKGETELEVMTRLIWQERQDSLIAIEKAVAAALAGEDEMVTPKARVLPWRPPSRSLGPL